LWAIINATAIGLLLIAASGCESRHLTHTWPDGSVSEYQRTTIGRSNTEGVTLQYGEFSASLEASGSREGELVQSAVGAAVREALNAGGAGQ
jgi:hypothetical protein